MTKKTRKLRKTKKLAALLQLALLGGSMLAGTRAAYATTIYYYSQNTAGQPINDPKSINELTVWEQHARINITYGETMAVAYCYDEAKLPSHKGWAYTDGGQIIIHDSQDVPWYLIGSFAKSDNSPGCPHDTATAQNGLVEYIAEGNVLSPLSQEHRDHFIGGYASANETAIAKNNTVNFGVTGAQCLGSVNSLYGGWAYWNNSGAAMSRSITAAGNTVNLQNTGADYSYTHTYPGIASAIDAAVFGGYAQQVYEFDDVTWDNKPLISTNTIAADGNTVNISGGRANGKAAGGAAEVSSLKDYTVTSNSTFKMSANTNAVNISGGILGANVYGGYVSADSFVQKAVIQAAADGNKVALTGGTINNAVYGGYVDLGGNTETTSTASASNNSVKLDGSIVNGDVYGGYTSNKSTTANNVIDYTRGSVSGTIYGGNGTSNAGNILNVRGSGFTAGNIANLAKVNLYLPSTVTTAARVLTLNGGSVTDLTGTEIQAMAGAGTVLNVGDQITLLYNAAGISGLKAGSSDGVINCNAIGNDSSFSVAATDSAVIGTVTRTTAAKVAPTTGDTALNLLAADSTVTRAVDGSVYGDYHADGTASTGTVAYDGGSNAVGQNLYGAYSYGSNASARNSQVTLVSGTVGGSVVGGAAVSGDGTNASATENTVNLKSGTVGGDVYGGYSEQSADRNTVNLDGASVKGNVYGGRAGKSTTENTINLKSGTVSGTIYGGSGTSSSGNTLNVYGTGLTAGNLANLNKVNFYLPSTVTKDTRVLTLNGGNVTDLTGTEIQAMTNSDTILSVGDQITLLYNAAGVSGVKGGNTAAMVNSAAVGYDSVINVSATDSAVIGTVTKPTIAKIAPTADDTALNLLAADSTVKRAVAGSTYGAYSADGTASTGTVAYDGGSSAVGQNLYGAYTYGSHAAASKSQATLVSGTVDGSIIGGAAVSSDDTETSAVDNTVKLQSGTVRGNVYGGFAGHSAVGNTVDLNGAHVAGDVYGGYALHSVTTGNTINWTSGDVAGTVYGGNETDYTGNILNIYGNSLTAGNLANFATINYYLPDSTANGSTIVTLTGGGTTDLTGTTVTVNAEGVSSLAIGDTVTLLTTNGTLKTSDTTLSGTLTKGVSMDYALSLAANSNSLTMNVESGVLKPQTKSLAETRGGQAAFLNGGADFLAGTGMARATEAARSSDGKTVSEFAPFYGAGGSAMRANTGSYVDLKGQNMTLGLAREIKQASGRLLFGPVCEYGAGRYTSHLDDGTRGDGNTHYYGAGLFAREEQDNGCYYEGSLRMGHTTSDYRSYDLKGATSTRDGHVSYDTKTNYWGAHLGAGQVRKLANGDSLDLYGKYFYGRTGSTDTTLSSGETYHFDAVNSHRLHLGGRYTHVVNDQSSIYAGAAWQYEFGGDARASYKGFSTPAPSLKGSSGMLELGWQVKPSKSPVTIDLGLTGWVGRQPGVTFQAGAQWAF